QNRHQRLLIELIEGGHHGQAADEFRDQAEADQVLRFDVVEQVRAVRLGIGAAYFRRKADTALLGAVENDLFEAGEGAAADEQDVRSIDLQEFLLRVLASALGGHRGKRALNQLEKRLLHALARDVARDRRVIGLARYLVDLIDIDDAGLRLLDVVVALLQQLLDDVFHVLADVPRLGQRGGIGDREGYVQQARQSLGEQRLAAAGRADQQDVALGQFNLVLRPGAAAGLQALIVVVDRHREDLLGPVLADDVLVEHLANLVGLGQLVARPVGSILQLFADDVVA